LFLALKPLFLARQPLFLAWHPLFLALHLLFPQTLARNALIFARHLLFLATDVPCSEFAFPLQRLPLLVQGELAWFSNLFIVE